MIVKLKYEEVAGAALKGAVEGKVYNFFMRVEVDETNITEAIETLKGNKWCVGLDYRGNLGVLRAVEAKGVKILVETDTLDALDARLDNFVGSVPPHIRVIAKVEPEYCNMRKIEEYSIKYSNLRFCGGNLIRLDGCSIGCITTNDVFKKVADNRLPIVTSGCSCVYKNLSLGELDSVEFYTDMSKGFKVDALKAPKKQLSSLVSLAKAKGTDFF